MIVGHGVAFATVWELLNVPRSIEDMSLMSTFLGCWSLIPKDGGSEVLISLYLAVLTLLLTVAPSAVQM